MSELIAPAPDPLLEMSDPLSAHTITLTFAAIVPNEAAFAGAGVEGGGGEEGEDLNYPGREQGNYDTGGGSPIKARPPNAPRPNAAHTPSSRNSPTSSFPSKVILGF